MAVLMQTFIDDKIYCRPHVTLSASMYDEVYRGRKLRNIYNGIKGYAVPKEIEFRVNSEELVSWIENRIYDYRSDEKACLCNISRFLGDYPKSLDDFIFLPQSVGIVLGRISNRGKGMLYSSWISSHCMFSVSKSPVIRKARKFNDELECHLYGLTELVNWLKSIVVECDLIGHSLHKMEEVIAYIEEHIENKWEYRPLMVNMSALINNSCRVKTLK